MLVLLVVRIAASRSESTLEILQLEPEIEVGSSMDLNLSSCPYRMSHQLVLKQIPTPFPSSAWLSPLLKPWLPSESLVERDPRRLQSSAFLPPKLLELQ